MGGPHAYHAKVIHGQSGVERGIQMARALFLNGGLEGHVNPTLELVRELVSRREEVVYVTTESMRHRVQETGADVRTFDGTQFSDAMRVGNVRNFVGVATGLLRTADVVIPRVLEEIQGERFDYLIHDSILGCGRVLAELLDMPAIASCTTFARSWRVVERMLDDLSSSMSQEEYQRLIEDFHVVRHAVNQRYGVTIDSVYDAYCNPAPMTIVYTSRYFQPDNEHFDESYKFVGPTVTATTRGPFDWEVSRNPMIYISLGTVFNQAPDFYRLCFQSLGESPYQVVVSVGTKTVIEDLGFVPPNFVVKPYVPQLGVLDHAQLFITHGGMNSVHEGLLKGVPLLVFPQGADQFDVGARVAQMGAGVVLDQRQLSSTDFRNHVEDILDNPTIRGVCRHIGESLRGSGGAMRAADEIFQFKAALGVG